MTMHVSVTDFVRNFADLINRVVYLGESMVLVRGGKELAEVRPIARGRRLGDLPALLRSLPRLEAEDAVRFEEEIGRARAELPTARDPWAS